MYRNHRKWIAMLTLTSLGLSQLLSTTGFAVNKTTQIQVASEQKNRIDSYFLDTGLAEMVAEALGKKPQDKILKSDLQSVKTLSSKYNKTLIVNLDGLENLSNLERLDVSDNSIFEIPKDVGLLVRSGRLSIDTNRQILREKKTFEKNHKFTIEDITPKLIMQLKDLHSIPLNKIDGVFSIRKWGSNVDTTMRISHINQGVDINTLFDGIGTYEIIYETDKSIQLEKIGLSHIVARTMVKIESGYKENDHVIDLQFRTPSGEYKVVINGFLTGEFRNGRHTLLPSQITAQKLSIMFVNNSMLEYNTVGMEGVTKLQINVVYGKIAGIYIEGRAHTPMGSPEDFQIAQGVL